MYIQILLIQTQIYTQIHMQIYKTSYMHYINTQIGIFANVKHKCIHMHTCMHIQAYICKYTPKAYMKHTCIHISMYPQTCA